MTATISLSCHLLSHAKRGRRATKQVGFWPTVPSPCFIEKTREGTKKVFQKLEKIRLSLHTRADGQLAATAQRAHQWQTPTMRRSNIKLE